jgi:transposase
MSAGGVIADRAYDSNALRELIAQAGAKAVIPSTRSASSSFRTMRRLIGCATGSSASSTNSSTFAT